MNIYIDASFNSNDFCIKTKNCSLNGQKKFECGKYCTKNSIDCNYYNYAFLRN